MTRVRLAAVLALALLWPSMPARRAHGLPARTSSPRAATSWRRRCERGLLVMFGATQAHARAALPPGQRLLLSHRQRSAERRAGHGCRHEGVAPVPAQADAHRDPLRGRQLARRTGRRQGVRLHVHSAAVRAARVPRPAARRVGHRDALDAAVRTRRGEQRPRGRGHRDRPPAGQSVRPAAQRGRARGSRRCGCSSPTTSSGTSRRTSTGCG